MSFHLIDGYSSLATEATLLWLLPNLNMHTSWPELGLLGFTYAASGGSTYMFKSCITYNARLGFVSMPMCSSISL